MNILITGTAGFIGFHLVSHLIKDGNSIIGLDSINNYYDVNLKYSRLKEHGIYKDEIQYNQVIASKNFPDYSFVQLDLSDKDNLFKLFDEQGFDQVIHLAAQAGVRYSFSHPDAYLKSNWEGFLNTLEACRHYDVKHLVYASSSSVYGLNEKMPFSENDNVDHPISLYAASKKSNELMAHTYSYLFNLPTTGLRFFTVYGPWGRPDMALFKFTKAILDDKPIDVYNHGEMQRDFTYIDDIVDGISKVSQNTPLPNKNWSGKAPDPFSSMAPYKVYNIGNSSPVHLMDFIHAIENSLGREAQKNYLPLQPGDVPKTWADVENLKNDMGYQPTTSVKEGVIKFIDWYRNYYQV
ncbi:MAG: NAD-dependent epimerase [Bacteroidales bacterium]